MKNFQVPTREQVAPAAQGVFDNLQKGLGFVPNIFATIAHSPNALTNYLAFQQGQAKGAFSAKEREAVFLAVSQVNGCVYCQAAHTAIAKMNGFTDEEALQLRAATPADPKLRVLTQLAASITTNRGRADEQLVEAFFDLGYNEGAFIDLISLVNDISFANYVHNATQVPVDFPAAPELEAQPA